MSFNVTPPKGGAFTPNKMLLMNRERRMNMLSPMHGEKLFNADIETGKVINEWGFQKDGVDVAMKVSTAQKQACNTFFLVYKYFSYTFEDQQ